jgi:cell division protein FtsB
MLNRFAQSWILSVVILVILGFLISSIIQKKRDTGELDKTIAYLDTKIEELEDSDKSANLRESAQSDEYLELQARERLNYKLEGEKVVIVYREESPDGASLTEQTFADVAIGDFKNWQKWWRFVRGK